ncbi:MAG: hypothetical protein AAGE59_31295, partial [Cyanobacteria bacterium P01_F01_bin.86]
SPEVSALLDRFDTLSKSDQDIFMNELFSKQGLPVVVLGGVTSGTEVAQINIVLTDSQNIPEVIESIGEILTSTLKKKHGNIESSREESGDLDEGNDCRS